MLLKNIIPDFLLDADNVYRTRHFIVKQVLIIQKGEEEANQIVSYDVYYKRTPVLDRAYEIAFDDRKVINGKRLPSNMYIRKYIG